jgi:hypothetical protein
MGASEETENDAERGPEEVQAARSGEEPHDGAQEVPLFLRGRSDGPKGNAQDEKDGVGE